MPISIPFIDLHAHFPMHTPFPPAGGTPDPCKKETFDAFNHLVNYERGKPRVSLENWFADFGNRVTGFASVLHDPEDELLVDTGSEPRPGAFANIMAQLANVEEEIDATKGRVKIARNPGQVEDFVKRGQPFLFHTLEGGFSLGGDEKNVAKLAKYGVASIIPAHLLYRGVATCENAFPPVVEPLFKAELDNQPKIGLSGLGKRIVEACFRSKVIVDITHAREQALKDIFSIAGGYPKQPLISSHNAVRAINSAHLNLSDQVIRRIQKSGGVIGVIFYTHWLRKSSLDTRGDIQLITDVIDHIHNVTGTFDHIAIGSDLDGFISPISTCSNYSKMSAIVDPISYRYGFLAAEKILYANALRVLGAGWEGI